MSGTEATGSTRKKGSRRSAMEQAKDIEKGLRRARMAFILEGDESTAIAMHEMEKGLVQTLHDKRMRDAPKPVPE